jgi:hypothetical protein
MTMPHALSRWIRWLAAGLVVALAACSVLKLAYDQAPTLVSWRVNKALDLEGAQRDTARAAVREWFAWQRKAQLPAIAAFMERSQREATGTITPTLACERRQEIEGWLRAGADRAAPLFARVAVQLTPAHIDHLQKHFKDKDEDFADDFLDDDAKDRQEAAEKYVEKWMERFYGRMDKDQRRQIASEVERLPFDAAAINQQRQRVQNNLIVLLRKLHDQKATAEQAQGPILALLHDAIMPTDPRQKADMERWISAGCQMAASLHNHTSADQRRTVVDRLKGWTGDLNALSKAAPQ